MSVLFHMLTAIVPLAPAAAKSEICFPVNGPSNLSAVIVPLSDTSFIGESYLNSVTTTGPWLLQCL
jgi:hypothetical protein